MRGKQKEGAWSVAEGNYAVPRLKSLFKQRRRRLTLGCLLETVLDLGRAFGSLSGLAYVAVVFCVMLQQLKLTQYLEKHVSSLAWLSLCAEVPLLIHFLWFWREESAARAAPTQWLVYSWMHAAKVVVLYCRVMPRLPSSGVLTVQSVGGISLSGASWGDNSTSTNLSNVLLLTPVFYALLMFRTSVAIFGRTSQKITVDLIMHFDMLWHVVVDMVDQVGMFSDFARLPEWLAPNVVEHNQTTLVSVQRIVPFFLFLAMTMQAQALPGVAVDNWVIPEPPPQEETSDEDSDQGGVATTTGAMGDSPWESVEEFGSYRTSTFGTRLGAESSFVPSGSVVVRQDSSQRHHGLTERISRAPALRYTGQGARPRQRVEGAASDGQVCRERERRTRFQAIIYLIHRHNIITARKRSAVVSTCFVDLPFLTVRLLLFVLTTRDGAPSYFMWGVKNLMFMTLNAIQYPMVRLTSQNLAAEIDRRLAEYNCWYLGAAKRIATGGQGGQDAQGVRPASVPTAMPVDVDAHMSTEAYAPPTPLAPQCSDGREHQEQNEATGAPQDLAADGPHVVSRAKAAARHKSNISSDEAEILTEAERQVRSETVKGTDVCVHFWALTIAFIAGYAILAREEALCSFMALLPHQPEKSRC